MDWMCVDPVVRASVTQWGQAESNMRPDAKVREMYLRSGSAESFSLNSPKQVYCWFTDVYLWEGFLCLRATFGLAL